MDLLIMGSNDPTILHRLFVTRAGSIYHFTPEVTSCSLCLTDPLMNNWLVVQPVNRIPLMLMEGGAPCSRPGVSA